VRYWVQFSVLNCKYPDFFMVFLSLSIQDASYYLNVCHDHFLPCHFQYIVRFFIISAVTNASLNIARLDES